jgi:hypothetical protein
MEIHERSVQEAVHKVEAEPGTGDAAWFAARQPGIIRFLELRCGRDDAMGAALMTTLAIHTAFERALGVPPPRLLSSAVERAEERVLAEAQGGGPRFAHRQPALAELIAGVVASPPVPLSDDEATRLALVLAAVVDAFDDAVTHDA